MTVILYWNWLTHFKLLVFITKFSFAIVGIDWNNFENIINNSTLKNFIVNITSKLLIY